jgi:hypothetical protein
MGRNMEAVTHSVVVSHSVVKYVNGVVRGVHVSHTNYGRPQRLRSVESMLIPIRPRQNPTWNTPLEPKTQPR